jgi:hypothetical protein
MPRFAPSICSTCGRTHWGRPDKPCVTCEPRKAARRVDRPGQKPTRYCVDCGKRCAGERCHDCFVARCEARKPRCVDCQAPLTTRSKRCWTCEAKRRMASKIFKPIRIARRRGRCLDLTRKGFACPISWGPLDHRHCPTVGCFRPMRPDQEQCSACTALELMAGRMEITVIASLVPTAAAGAASWPLEGSKSWRQLPEDLVESLDGLGVDPDLEAELDRLAAQDIHQHAPGSPAAYRSLAQ